LSQAQKKLEFMEMVGQREWLPLRVALALESMTTSVPFALSVYIMLPWSKDSSRTVPRATLWLIWLKEFAILEHCRRPCKTA
jgi:hypothetical protein